MCTQGPRLPPLLTLLSSLPPPRINVTLFSYIMCVCRCCWAPHLACSSGMNSVCVQSRCSSGVHGSIHSSDGSIVAEEAGALNETVFFGVVYLCGFSLFYDGSSEWWDCPSCIQVACITLLPDAAESCYSWTQGCSAAFYQFSTGRDAEDDFPCI